jgi:hypothetical protein
MPAVSRFPDVDKAAAQVTRVAPAVLDAARAEAIVQERIRGSALRPHDIGRAPIDPVGLLYVPFFRVRVAIDGFHVGLTGASVRVGGATIPIPSGGSRHDDQDVIACARREFPFPARLARTRLGGETPVASVRLDQLVDAAQLDFAGAERVQPNVTRQAAEDDAVRVVRRASEPRSGALFAQYDARVKDVDLWLHPVFFTRYRYDGDARRHPEEDCFVAVCGRTGGVVAEHHPSALRSVVARARKLLWE